MDPPPAGTPQQAEQWMRVAEKLLVVKDLEGCREFSSQALAANSRTPGAQDLHAAANVLLAAVRRRMPNGQPNHYAILGLDPANPASRHPDVVHSSYRRISLLLNRYPPDRPTSASVAEAARLVADAWTFLSNSGLKSALDSELDAAAPARAPAPAPVQLHQPQPSPRPQQRATGAAPQPRPSPQQSPAAPQPPLLPQPSPPRAAAPPPIPRQSPVSVWAAPQLRPPPQQSPIPAAPEPRPPPQQSPIPAAPETRPPPRQSPIQAAPQPRPPQAAPQPRLPPRQSPIPSAPQPRPPAQQSPIPTAHQPPLPQQPSPLPADPQPPAGAVAQPVESGTPPSPTFWTTCKVCSHIHQYDRLYEARKLKCSSCHQPFVAEAMAEPPPIVPGTDMYYCTWGFFPIGFPGCPAFESLVNKQPQGPDQLNAPWLGANGVVDANAGVEDNGGADVQNGTPVSASVELPEVLEPEPLMRMRVQVPAAPEPVMPRRVEVPAMPEAVMPTRVEMLAAPKPVKTMTMNSVKVGGKKRGRPKGSKNKKGTKNNKNL